MTNAPFRRQWKIQGRNSPESDLPADSRRVVVLYFSLSFGHAEAGCVCYPAGHGGSSRTRGMAWRRATAVLPGRGHDLPDVNSWTVAEETSHPEAPGGSQQNHFCRKRGWDACSTCGIFRSPPTCCRVALGDAQHRARVGTCTKGDPEGCFHNKSLN